MRLKERELSSKYHLNFKVFLELMSAKVREILRNPAATMHSS